MIDHSDTITLRIIQYKSELVPELLKIFETNSWSNILTTVRVSQQFTHKNQWIHDKVLINFRIADDFGEMFGMVNVGQLYTECIKRQRHENVGAFAKGETKY